jgi:hypothetical protein
VSSHIRDPVGTSVAAAVGVALGLTLAAPLLPQQLGLDADISGGHVTTILTLGSLGLIAVPFGVLLLYLLLSRTDQ